MSLGTKLEKAFSYTSNVSLKLIFRKGLKPSFNLFKTLTNYLWKLQLFMFFLLKYLNLKFSNKFRPLLPLSPNIIDTSIYYSITISTPWFIQTDIIFTGGWQGWTGRDRAIIFKNFNPGTFSYGWCCTSSIDRTSSKYITLLLLI